MKRQRTPNLLEAAALDNVIKIPGLVSDNGGGEMPGAKRVRRSYLFRAEAVEELEQVALLERYGGKGLSVVANALLEVGLELYADGLLEGNFRLESDGKKRFVFFRVSTP